MTTHPERFRPLHEVGDALISHLVASYDVEVAQWSRRARRRSAAAAEVVRTTELRPRARRAAPLTIAHTTFPGVVVHAGVLLDVTYPVCGCDACDDTWQAQASDLEWLVGAVTAGRFREWVARRDGQAWVGHSRG